MTAVYAMRICAVSPDEPTLRALLSPDRLAYIDRLHGSGRAQSFAASVLLSRAVALHVPALTQPLEILIAPQGKPYFAHHPDCCFSLSHAGEWAVCALSDHPVGVDIERCTDGRRDIAARFFHEEEVRLLRSLPAAQHDNAFYALWVLKEAFVKATGQGLALPLRSFWIELGAPPVLHADKPVVPYTLTLLPFAAADGYCVGLCEQQAHASAPTLTILDEPLAFST